MMDGVESWDLLSPVSLSEPSVSISDQPSPSVLVYLGSLGHHEVLRAYVHIQFDRYVQ